MIPKVEKAHYIGDYTVHIQFSDGTEGEVYLGDELYGDIFEDLKEETFFSSFSIHPEFHTLCWRNGADFAPEFLYVKIKVPA